MSNDQPAVPGVAIPVRQVRPQSLAPDPRPLSACLVFLGCPKNQVDSEHVLGSLTEAGYNLTIDPRSADLVVITTCAFLQSAVRESEAAIREALKLKQGNSKTRNGQHEPPMHTDSRADACQEAISVHPCPSVVGRSSRYPAVVVAGCLVQRYGKTLKRRFPAVDLWVPLRDMPRLAERLSPIAPRLHQSKIQDPKPRIRPCSPRVLSTPGHFAYLKIADGCDNRCSYCMIPDIRGPFRSRPMRDIIAEARDLARAGVKELILVAQDTTLYGTDLPKGVHHKDTKTRISRLAPATDIEATKALLRRSTNLEVRIPIEARMGNDGFGDSGLNRHSGFGFRACTSLSLWPSTSESGLAELLDRLRRIDGVRWLRLMYTHPAHLTEDVIDQFASNPKLCRYIDLPIQHVAGHLLDRMNRHYTRKDIEIQLESLRAIPDMHIRTTIITSLPGETTRDFDELLAFVRAARFDRLSCYAYSPEPGTKAARLRGQLSPAVKKERVRRLMLAQAAISRANLKKLVGRKLTVLVDSPGIARTRWDAPEIDGVVKLTGRRVNSGDFVQALVTGFSTHDLTARVI
jgi:ribosomal protein S12 methylthiotransferase